MPERPQAVFARAAGYVPCVFPPGPLARLRARLDIGPAWWRTASPGPGCGALVDHEALVAELRTGRPSAVLDVTDPEPLPADSPLSDLPDVFLTPHLAGSQGDEAARLGASVVEEAARWAAGGPAPARGRPRDTGPDGLRNPSRARPRDPAPSRPSRGHTVGQYA